nr:retrovirus-related Pol polyprotein from transposon TNT 1-94 [Tanacetum cinerariifolium]
MASAILCLATNQKFNFSRYILLSLVKNVESGVPFFMFSRFVQLIINHQLSDMAHYKEIFDTPSLTKKVFANMKRVGTRFSGEITLLFDNMLVQAPKEVAEQNLPSPSNDPLPSGEDSLKLKELIDLCTNLSNKVLELESKVIDIKSTYQERIEKLEGRVERLEEENRVLKELKSAHSIDDGAEPIMEKDKSSKQGRKIADINADVEINLQKAQAEAYNLDLDHQEKVLSMMDVNEEEPANVEEVLEVVEAAKLMTEVVTIAGATKVSVPRKRRGVIIQDPEETTTTSTVQPKVQAKDKGKAILIEEPKPLKRKPLTQAQARRNMIVYLKNIAGFKMDYFKGMTYDEIIPLFEKHYNYNQAFLDVVNKGVKVSDTKVSSKREDATPLASKIPIIDYKIHTEGNRSYFKIIRADGNHMLFISLNTMLKNFDREDLESPWIIIFLLVERIYPLTHFTLEQMLNDVRLQVEEESEMSLKLLRLVRKIPSHKGIYKFGMKELGEAKKILGMEIVKDRSRKILRVSQSGYVFKILNNFRIDNEKLVKMPLGGHFKLSLKDWPVRDCDVERMSKVPYTNAVGSLTYLMVCTRPDIAYAGTANVGLVYGKNHGNHVDVTGFVDSYYAKDPDKGRSITGYAFLVQGCVVSWKATLQHVMALSTTEAEYMALMKAVKKAIWLRGLLKEEVLKAKTVKVLKVGTEHNAADALTNVVLGLKLQHCLELLNVGVG